MMRATQHRLTASRVAPCPGAEATADEAVVLLSGDTPGGLWLRAVLQARGLEVRLGPAMVDRPAAIVAIGGDLAHPPGRDRLAVLRRHLPAVPLFVVDEAALARMGGPTPTAEDACTVLAASGLGRFA